MVKKILLIIAFIITIGAGVAGTLYFYNQNKNQIQQNQTLAAQNTQIQAELNAIGDLTTVYEVSTKVYSGKEIKETDLIPVSVPVSTCNTASITDATQLIGKFYKVDINPGTILSADMLMDDANEVNQVITRELNFTSLPVSLIAGDYVDLRFMLPTGEEFVVLPHERVEGVYDTTITIHVSEEENAILNSLFADLGQYNGYVFAYLAKYIEPGKNTNTVAFYPVQADAGNLLKLNPNIKDVSRCVNPTLRAHIDEVLLVCTDSNNQETAAAYIEIMQAQFQAQLDAHSLWIEEHTDEEGNLIVNGQIIKSTNKEDGSTPVTDGSTSSDPSLNTGENMENLQNNLGQLQEEGIQ